MANEAKIKQLKKKYNQNLKIKNEARVYGKEYCEAEKEMKIALEGLYKLGWSREKERKERALRKELETLEISERGVNFLFNQMKLKGITFKSRGRELDYKLMWVVDYLSSEVSKQCGFSKAKKDELALFRSEADFNKVVGDIREEGESKTNVVDVSFMASEVRNFWGLTSDEMSVEGVLNEFKEFQGVIFEAEGEKIFRDVEKKQWVQRGVSDPLYHLEWKREGVFSNRWKTQDIRITLYFGGINILSWIFLANLSAGRAGRLTLPHEARLRLSGYEQNILRWIRMWPKPTRLNILDLAKIAGLRNKKVEALKASLILALENLKAEGYIKDFK